MCQLVRGIVCSQALRFQKLCRVRLLRAAPSLAAAVSVCAARTAITAAIATIAAQHAATAACPTSVATSISATVPATFA